jgi:predicted nuclease of restriction endonuclease-like (RecB) superfamily
MTNRPAKLPARAKRKIVQAPLAQTSRATLEAAPVGYVDWIRDLKARVYEARQRAARAVNNELVGLYWRIGRDIRARQEVQGWGAKIVDRIAADLKTEFPDSEGFSPRNLKYMRAFALAWPDEDFVQGVLAQLPWYTHIALLEKLETLAERRWYAQQAIEHGWSRNVLVLQIEANAMKRTGAALTNIAPFTTVVMDEAGLLSRATVAALSLLAARRVVLAGDPRELAPIAAVPLTVRSGSARGRGRCGPRGRPCGGSRCTRGGCNRRRMAGCSARSGRMRRR